MEFRTKIETPYLGFELDHRCKMLMMGSCFAQNVGNLLIQSKFDLILNPYGVLYNPASISKALNRLLDKKTFSEDELFEHKGVYNSFWHHSQFSDIDKSRCLERINTAFGKSVERLHDCDVLFITFGTSYVFELQSNGEVVGNCHKLPALVFNRSRLTVDDIVADWTRLIDRLLEVNPRLRVVFTVSPIRHLKDGLHDNQLSKSILLLAVDKLCSEYDACCYFPAYEIVLDDLRDYRFYDEDMVHPNGLAVKYIWGVFSEVFFDKKTIEIISEWNKLQMAVNHRPLNINSSEYGLFVDQTIDKLKIFQQKYPYICCDNEIKLLEARR